MNIVILSQVLRLQKNIKEAKILFFETTKKVLEEEL
jgi:hypothetical protein